MAKRVEATGKTTEEAIQAALAELGCAREDVTVEELVKPRRVALVADEMPVLADGVGELLLPADAAAPRHRDQLVAQGFSAEHAAGKGAACFFAPPGDLTTARHGNHLFLFQYTNIIS